MALVYTELSKSMASGILVRLADNPRWCVTDTQVQHFTSYDQVMQRLHQFRDGGGSVPPVKIQEVNVGSLKLLKTRFERYLQALGVISLVIGLLVNGTSRIASCEFGSDDHLISDLACGHPFPNPDLALLPLVVVCRVDEVSAHVVKVIQHFEARLLITFTHELLPRITKIHRSEA